jgi:hypothetical protein
MRRFNPIRSMAHSGWTHRSATAGDRLEWPELRETIGRLVWFQAGAEHGGVDAMRAYVDGLQSSDPHIRLWAASTGYQRVRQPTPDLELGAQSERRSTWKPRLADCTRQIAVTPEWTLTPTLDDRGVQTVGNSTWRLGLCQTDRAWPQ